MNKFKLWFSKTYISNEISWHGWRYGIAVLAVALATAIKFLLLHLFAIESPFLVMLVAVMVSALYGGMRAGVLATVLSALISYYLFISPTYMFIGKPTGQNLRLIIFITEGLLISRIISALKYTQRRLKLEEVSLRQSEELNRLMVDAVQDYAIFMLDPDGYVVNWNKGAQRLKGYRANEIVGQHFSGFYVQEEIEQRLPELALQQAAVNGWVEHEGWRVRKDSSRFWANVVITALRDEAGKLRGFSQVTRDMTDRKQAQEQLANVNTILEQRVQERTAQLDQAKNEAQLGFNRLNGIIESTKDLIVALDLDFRFVAFNSAYKQEFAKVNGKQIELGMSIIDVLAHLPTEQAKARETWGRALRGEEFTIIEQFGEPNKLEFGYYEVNCNPIKDENEQLIGACQRVRDVSDRIRAETEIRNLNHELEERVIERTQALEAQIQERIKIEVNLRESEDRFRTLADNISQLAWMADAQGWIFWYNRRWFEYTGTTLEEMQGWGWQKVHH
ncbi:MAG TPA: PAS domain S-box protein, partial [Phormidium sp.]